MLVTSSGLETRTSPGPSLRSRLLAASAAIAGMTAAMMFVSVALLILAVAAVEIFIPPIGAVLGRSPG